MKMQLRRSLSIGVFVGREERPMQSIILSPPGFSTLSKSDLFQVDSSAYFIATRMIVESSLAAFVGRTTPSLCNIQGVVIAICSPVSYSWCCQCLVSGKF